MVMAESKKQFLCEKISKDSSIAQAVFFVATHRSCYFVATPYIMYTLSWKGCGETIRILFDSEDSAKIWDEFFVFGKAE